MIFDPTPGAHSERVSADRGWPEKSAPGRFHLHFPDTVHILQIKTYRHWKQPNKRWERTHNNLSSQHTGLGVLQLFCSVCLSWFKPHLHLIPEKTDSGTITECLLGNGSCVLCANPDFSEVAMETRHERRCLCFCEWIESAGQSATAKRTEGQVREPMVQQDHHGIHMLQLEPPVWRAALRDLSTGQSLGFSCNMLFLHV